MFTELGVEKPPKLLDYSQRNRKIAEKKTVQRARLANDIAGIQKYVSDKKVMKVIKNIFEEFDVDGNGILDYTEAQVMMEKLRETMPLMPHVS